MPINLSNIDLDRIIEVQKKIVPELIEKLMERYDILRFIHYNQPIGRRNLSQVMGIGERIIRSEVNLLKNEGLIEIKAEGMNTTESGENILETLRDIIHSFKGLSNIENELTRRLEIKKVMIVPSLDKGNDVVLKEIGRVTSNYLKSILRQNMVVAFTGGETMAMVAEEMTPENSRYSNIVVVPGRGGMGREVEKQANTIAAKVASKLKGSYKLLHMPDNIAKDVMATLSEDPSVKEVINYIQQSDVLVFGIGRADKMARRRELEDKLIEKLHQKGAVAEAFGYYFNQQASIVHEVNTVGVSLEYYKGMKNIIGAATGEEKAEAIIAISKLNNNLVLVIDERLAKEILKKS